MRTATEDANCAVVMRMYDEVLTPLDSSAVDGLVHPDYIQHNPNVESGADGLKRMLDTSRVKRGRVEHHVKRMAADGDLVFAHVNTIFEPDTLGFAIVDIFRIVDGLIVEHWDVLQPVGGEARNTNGMF